ncbi:VOC family protein [Flagellimonas sp. HMM57]|uniref:VOC family protein n=1 Tax=unclassified Flagellimonas TaxID=2644544 RepID=UPI0013D6EB5D|nr:MULTISPECIES: VOC family protein [unclassified Flagellimonas]UII77742.1 VOC family protein [Flagellimonas sp. HMM57]
MRIEHLAIWVQDLEAMKTFYENYFKAKSSKKYHNPTKKFTSYFLSFNKGTRLELMHRPDIKVFDKTEERTGIAHFAVSVGCKAVVDALTETLRKDGFDIIGEPRTTGDGYYESVVMDPEQNRIEITV